MDPAPPAAAVKGPATQPGIPDKVRLVFRKDRSLRWLSHHDLLRTFERVLRRADLPVRTGQGFNPRPKIVFALSLPLGVVGRAEIMDVELSEVMEPEVFRAKATFQCPPGLEITDARRISPKAGVHVTGFTYAIPVPEARRDAVREAIERAGSLPEFLVRRTKPAPKTLDIRPFVRELRLTPEGRLEMALHLTPAGTARPEEILRLVGAEDLLEAGEPLERTELLVREDAA